MLVPLLFVAEILACTCQLIQYNGRCNGFVGIKHSFNKAITLQPGSLLAAILAYLVLREGVIGSQGQIVGRCRLYGKLRIDTFTFDICKGVTNIIGNTVQLSVFRCIDYGGIRSERAAINIVLIDGVTGAGRGMTIPSLDMPIVDRRLN